jgi:hypothetical protein
MSRKHFIAMAASFKQMADVSARKEAALAFAEVASSMNPRFNYQRFMEACGL